MGWFNKKKNEEEIPKLPELPELPDFPEVSDAEAKMSSEELPDVPPGLPEIETKMLREPEPRLSQLPYNEAENFEREKIKREINRSENPPFNPYFSSSEKIIRQSKIPAPTRSFGPSIASEEQIKPDFDYNQKRTLEIPASRISMASQKMTKKIEPIFVRLDKFEMTIQTFEEIKNKIEEIEEVLIKTREIKIKEEQELSEWEKEIQMIKSRIEMIDKTVFNKLD